MAGAKLVLVLGGGFGGLASANLIRKGLSQEECEITVVDKNQHFMMGLVNLWIKWEQKTGGFSGLFE
jgi:sulfide:quinone oxidoreductase